MIITLLLVVLFAVLACLGGAAVVALRNPLLKLLGLLVTAGSVGMILFGLGGAQFLYRCADLAAASIGGADGLLFWVFAILTCGGAIAVVAVQNVVRMAFWLVVSLGSVAALFFLLHADFLGAAQLLIYVGGTVVLLVFGVMLTASGHTIRVQTSPAETMLGGGVGLILLCVLLFAIGSVDWADISSRIPEAGDSPAVADVNEDQRLDQRLANASGDEGKAEARLSIESVEARRQSGRTLRQLGLSFYGLRPDVNLNQPANHNLAPGYLLPFEIISIHLLVVLVGAAYLARAKRRVSPDSGAEL